MLENISTDFTSRGRAIVIHGPIGIGKTEFCAAAVTQTGGVFIHHKKEQGINDLKKSGDVPPNLPTIEFETWDQLLEILTELASDDTSDRWKTVVIDSLTWVEQECYATVCKEDFGGDFSKKGFYDYWAGPRMASSRYWPAMIELLETNAQLDRNVFCIAHTKTKDIFNQEGESYEQSQPEMDRDSFKLFTIWAQHVIFMSYDMEVEKENKRSKGKVTSSSRQMRMIGRPNFIAKSKGFPDEIPMGENGREAWQNFLAAENTKNKTTPAMFVPASTIVTPKKVAKSINIKTTPPLKGESAPADKNLSTMKKFTPKKSTGSGKKLYEGHSSDDEVPF